jgi:hypothetical protein
MRIGPVSGRATGRVLLALLLAPNRSAATLPKDQSAAARPLRWAEGDPGCTFSRDEDGRYRYGLWVADFGIVLAVDSQELEKVRRRAQHTFSLHLTVRYRGKDSLDVVPDTITLEFVNHYHDSQMAVAPDDLVGKQQEEQKTLTEETARRIRKHPEKKSQEEAAMAERQKNISEMIDFLNTRSLRPVKLGPSQSEASGWIYFKTTSKWIDELHKQEEFILRIPVGDRVIEFPFVLPPSEDDLILRRRPEN